MSPALTAVLWITILAQPQPPLDMNKLARAVSAAESSGCHSAVSDRTNNCHGIMRNGQYVEFANTQESYAAFKRIWQHSYGGFPTRAKAARYSSEGAADRWLCNVQRVYYHLPLTCV